MSIYSLASAAFTAAFEFHLKQRTCPSLLPVANWLPSLLQSTADTSCVCCVRVNMANRDRTCTMIVSKAQSPVTQCKRCDSAGRLTSHRHAVLSTLPLSTCTELLGCHDTHATQLVGVRSDDEAGGRAVIDGGGHLAAVE